MTAQAVTGSSLGKSQLWKFAEKKKDAAAQASSQEARSAQQAPAAVAIAGNALRAPDEARSLEELYAYLEELTQAHPGVSFDFLTLEDEAQLRVAAAALGAGAHFLLAPEFIQRMLSGREAFAAGKALLEEAFGRLCKSASQSGLRTGVGVYVAANEQAAQWTAQFSGAARQSQSLGPADWNADARYAGEIRSKQRRNETSCRAIRAGCVPFRSDQPCAECPRPFLITVFLAVFPKQAAFMQGRKPLILKARQISYAS